MFTMYAHIYLVESIYLSIYLSIYIYIYLASWLSVYLSFLSIYLSFFLSYLIISYHIISHHITSHHIYRAACSSSPCLPTPPSSRPNPPAAQQTGGRQLIVAVETEPQELGVNVQDPLDRALQGEELLVAFLRSRYMK